MAGEADEQVRENERQRQGDIQFPVLGERSLDHEQTMYYSYGDFAPPTGSHGLDQGMDFLASVLKSESDPFDWERLGIDTPALSSSDSDCSQDTTIQSVLGTLPDTDNTNPISHLPVRERVERQEDIGDSAEFVTHSRKRSCEEAFATEHAENDVGRAKQKVKTDADKHEKPRIQYACPFQKRDPLKHHECLKYELHRIKDVKQHVYRRHKQPDYYCARCFVVFDNADARDEHARSKDCENKKTSGFEGITDVEKKELNKSPSRGLDARQQWLRMWNIIFPGEEKPRSVYVGSYIEEMVPLLRSLYANKNSRTLAVAQTPEASLIDPSVLDAVMEKIFDCLEAEASASLGKRQCGSSSQNRQSLMDFQSPIFTYPARVIEESSDLLYAEPQYLVQDIKGDPEAKLSGVAFGEG